MAKKKVEDEVAEEEIVSKTMDEKVFPESYTAAQIKATQIQSFMDQVGDIEGEPFDPSLPEHLIVAAWIIGRKGMLRK